VDSESDSRTGVIRASRPSGGVGAQRVRRWLTVVVRRSCVVLPAYGTARLLGFCRGWDERFGSLIARIGAKILPGPQPAVDVSRGREPVRVAVRRNAANSTGNN
jgi:hypothetical protein